MKPDKMIKKKEQSENKKELFGNWKHDWLLKLTSPPPPQTPLEELHVELTQTEMIHCVPSPIKKKKIAAPIWNLIF